MRYNFDEIIDRVNDPYSYSLKWVVVVQSLTHV